VLALTVEDRGFIVHERPNGGEGFATGATIDVPGMVIGEVVAREGPVRADLSKTVTCGSIPYS
jgi:hypothetical protein